MAGWEETAAEKTKEILEHPKVDLVRSASRSPPGDGGPKLRVSWRKNSPWSLEVAPARLQLISRVTTLVGVACQLLLRLLHAAQNCRGRSLEHFLAFTGQKTQKDGALTVLCIAVEVLVVGVAIFVHDFGTDLSTGVCGEHKSQSRRWTFICEDSFVQPGYIVKKGLSLVLS